MTYFRREDLGCVRHATPLTRPSHMTGRHPHEDLDRGRVAVVLVEVVRVKQAYGVLASVWHDKEQRLLR